MLGVVDERSDPWITSKGPVPCSERNIKAACGAAFTMLDECKSKDSIQQNMLCALKAVLEMNFPNIKELPRNIVMVGNGVFDFQKQIDQLIATSLEKHNSRISAIGIGNGTADSFLRTITTKGSGLFELVNEAKEIEEKVDIFMKRLRMPTITNVSWEWDEKANIAYVLPVTKPKQTFLKGAPMELFVYFKESKIPDQLNQPIKMTYFDCEDGKSKQITFQLKPYTGRLEKKIYKLVMNQLLLAEAEIEESATNPESPLAKQSAAFKDLFGGENWASSLAVQHQIMSKHTAFLAVPFEHFPQDFDQMNDNLDELDPEFLERIALNKVVVPCLIPSDFIGGNNALGRLTSSAKTVLHQPLTRTNFSSRNFKLVETGVMRLHSAACQLSQASSTTSGPLRTQNTRSTGFDMSSIDQTDLLTKIHEADSDEEDMNTGARGQISSPHSGFGKGNGHTNVFDQMGYQPRPLEDTKLSEESTGKTKYGQGELNGCSCPGGSLSDLPKIPVFSETDLTLVSEIPKFLAQKQNQATGSFTIDDELLRVLRLTRSFLSALSQKLLISEEGLIVILANLYLKDQAWMAYYILTVKYIKIQKLENHPMYKQILEYITKELKLS